MAAPKRSKYQLQRDRSVLAKLYAMDMYSQDELADILNQATGAKYKLSQQQISYDIRIIEKEWREERVTEIDKIKNHELAKLAGIEMQYVRGFMRSIGERKKTAKKLKGKEGRETKEISINTEDHIGDPRWLDGVLSVIQVRAKMLGLDAPTQIDLKSIDLSQLNDIQLSRIANGEDIAVVLATSGESDT